MKKVAVVADARSGEMFAEMADVLNRLRLDGRRFKVMFLDCKQDVLLTRYKETRRKHPLQGELASGTVEDAVELEYELMRVVKEMADYVIDTTYTAPSQLKERVAAMFTGDTLESMLVTIVSFGFKYNLPLESDLVFDVRCLPNPFYVEELKHLTGLDEAVRDYVMSFDVTKQFLKKITDYLDFTLPLYKQEGKSELVIGVGCTGGKHRSVTIARQLNAYLIERDMKAAIHHRDIWKA